MAKIYVTIKEPGRHYYNAPLKIGRLPFFRRTISSANYDKVFVKLGIPLNKKLIVSDKDFKGATKIQGVPGYGTYFSPGISERLSFCGQELRRYFKDVPPNLYWKRA